MCAAVMIFVLAALACRIWWDSTHAENFPNAVVLIASFALGALLLLVFLG